MKVAILPDPASPVGYFPTQSRSGTCPAPVPYPPGDPHEVPALPLLVDAFIQGATIDEEENPDKRLRKGSLHFLASVFGNISAVGSCCAVRSLPLNVLRKLGANRPHVFPHAESQ